MCTRHKYVCLVCMCVFLVQINVFARVMAHRYLVPSLYLLDTLVRVRSPVRAEMHAERASCRMHEYANRLIACIHVLAWECISLATERNVRGFERIVLQGVCVPVCVQAAYIWAFLYTECRQHRRVSGNLLMEIVCIYVRMLMDAGHDEWRTMKERFGVHSVMSRWGEKTGIIWSDLILFVGFQVRMNRHVM